MLEAADKYSLLGLKKVCERSLMSSVKVENVIDTFIIADGHNAYALKDFAKAMIVEKGSEVVEQADWREKLQTSSRDLLLEVVEAFAKK